MSPKCSVMQLNQLALHSVVKQVTQALSDDEGAHYNDVINYHQYTPPDILEDILQQILNNAILDAGTRFSCLQVLLKNNVKKLETGMFPHSYYDRILEVINSKGSGLQHLNLKGVWIKDNTELLSSSLSQMIHLRVLHIPHIADNSVLKCLAKCVNLKVLNISGDCPFTKEGLDDFCQDIKGKMSCLSILDIGSFGDENIPHETIANIIQCLPHLHTLSSYSFVGKSLLYLYNKNKSFKCKLKHLHDTKTTPDICEAIINCCPALENLYFDSPTDGTVANISKMRNLNCLKINKFQCHDLHKMFESWGDSIRTLKLSLGRGILDLSKLCVSCPNVVTIELYKMEFISHTTNDLFYKLQSLEILYSEMSSLCLVYVLERSPELRKISVGEAAGITDGDLYRLCADYCLYSIEEIYFLSARYLTSNTVELLMGHCPHLRVLGWLNGWNISSNDTDFMRAVIQSTNSDLTLLPVGLYM